jgi:hypothetical protein
MLTLFKPWRSGKDLKSSDESWDKGFVAHEFTKRQMEIMKYFNLRYDCLDARDDYSAKRDKKDGDISYQWATADVLDDLDDLHDSELALLGADFDPGKEYDEVEGDLINSLGRKGASRRNEMLATERTMTMAGWLDECEDGIPDVGSLTPVKPEYDQSSKAWRAAVLAKKTSYFG